MKSFQFVFWLRFGAGGYAVTAKDVADRLIRNNVTEVRQRSNNPVITPAGVLARHPHYEFYDLVLNRRPTRIRALPRPVELLGDEPTVPRKDRIRFGDAGDLFESFTTQPFANLT